MWGWREPFIIGAESIKISRHLARFSKCQILCKTNQKQKQTTA
jgi:hypothetical protein